MSKQLMNVLGEHDPDNLIAKIYPPAETTGVMLKALEAETVIPRGAVLAMNGTDNLLVVLGTGEAAALTPAYILADDTTVGTENTPAVAYRAGCFNADALVTLNSHEITFAEEDALRARGIILHHNMQ